MNDKEVSKLCGICGDKAHGYNFNAITCESCKAFFRRNALRKKDFKCPFDNNCRIDLVTRKFCKKCRLKKCLDLGMKKEWILSDEEKVNLRNKIVENRKKRQTGQRLPSKVADSTTTYQFPNVVNLIQNNYDVNSERTTSSSNGDYPKSSPPAQDIEMHSIIKYTSNEVMGSVGAVAVPVVEHKPHSELQQIFADLSSPSQQSSLSTSGTPIGSPLKADETHKCNINPLKGLSAINECTDCYDSAPKPRNFPIDAINNSNDTNHSSSDIIYPNQCSVITDTSIETIKNSCIESFGCFSTKTTNNNSVHNNHNEESDHKEIVKLQKISNTVYQKVIELEFAAIPFKEMAAEDMNRFESLRIAELAAAVADLNRRSYGMSNEGLKITRELSNFIDMTKVLAVKCDDAIRRLVVMSKKIASFKELCQPDQIGLMKAGCFEILIMRSINTYNQEHDYWSVAMDQNNATMVKVELFKQTKGNLYEAHKNWMHAFAEEWDSDQTILNLLTAIVLFTPERPNIMHRELIKLEQQTYMYLLQRYLFAKYKSKCVAKLKFLRLMNNLEELHTLNEKHVKIYLEVDPQDVGPLLIEILDLHPYNTIQLL